MKIKKYGYSEFKTPMKMRYAVMVPWGPKGNVRWTSVTDIESYPHRTWRGQNHKKAFLWDNHKAAQQFCVELAYRDFAGFVVEVLEGMEPSNDYEEKKDEVSPET